MYFIFDAANEKMYYLEEERDFFRTQVMKLNGEVNTLMDENKNLKKKITDLTVEIENYKTIAFSTWLVIQTTRRKFKNFNMRETKWQALSVIHRLLLCQGLQS
jgi:flagellar biosynthesis chaperone FliJ